MKTNTTGNGAIETRIVAEKLAGKTLDGELNLTVRRHTLSAESESKVAMMKRLLMTAGQTKESILLAVKEKQGGTLTSADVATLNTVRADLKRTIGGLVVATGWRTDAMQGKLATQAVAKLRTHELGTSAFCVEAVRAGVVTLSTADAGAKVDTSADAAKVADVATVDAGADAGKVADVKKAGTSKKAKQDANKARKAKK